jgi:linoleoyl-CoA desaturase
MSHLPPIRYALRPETFRAEVRRRFRNERGSSLHEAGYRKARALAALGAVTLIVLVFGRAPLLVAVATASLQIVCFFSALGVGHDASHGAFSRSRQTNRRGTWMFDLVGVSGYVWHFDHVVSHHAAPNVPRYDANLYVWGPLRLDPTAPLRPWHRFQALYAPVLYALASLFKLYVEDFAVLARSRPDAFLPPRHSSFQVGRIALSKTWATAFTLGLPLVLHRADAAYVLSGWFVGHLVVGTLMGAFFQPTHTNELVRHPRATDEGNVALPWVEHVFATTVDFSIGNGWLTWLSGGLNVHAVHHLFPEVPHLELPRLARIVAEVAPRFGLHYRAFPTLLAALRSHYRALDALGRRAPPLELGVEGARGPI